MSSRLKNLYIRLSKSSRGVNDQEKEKEKITHVSRYQRECEFVNMLITAISDVT